MQAQPVSFDAPLQQATTVNAPAGVTFDAPTSTATTVDLSQPSQSLQPAVRNDELKYGPNDSALGIAANVAKTPLMALEGVGEGVSSTAAGASDIIDKTTGMQPGTANKFLHKLAGDENTPGSSTIANGAGYAGETMMEFLAGDEALKGLSLSDRLLASSKVAKALENSPRLMKALQIGADALRSGVTQGAVTTVKTGGDVKQGAEQGLLAGGLTAGVSAGIDAASAIKKPFSLKAVQDALQNSKESIQQTLQSNLQGIQDAWHSSVRDLFDQVAKESDVQPKPAESLRDIAANTAAAVKSKASAMYKQLDQALGGTRFQTFDEQINNVKRALRNSAGIDPDADGRLIERVNSLEDAKAAGLEQAKAAGVDPKLIDQANSAWRQASALDDLSKHIQASTSGLRGDLAQGVKAAPESLSPAKLASRANRMYSTGRLQQAVGEDHADNLLRNIERTKQQAQDAAANAERESESAKGTAAQQSVSVSRNRALATSAAGAVGAGGVYELLKHLLGN